MGAFFVILHVLVCISIVIIILMQSGRGGGLTESFVAAENMFGAKTNVMLTRLTTGLAVGFLVTALSLAFISARKNKSLMAGKVAVPQEEKKNTFLPNEAEESTEQPVQVPAPEARAVPEAETINVETTPPPVQVSPVVDQAVPVPETKKQQP